MEYNSFLPTSTGRQIRFPRNRIKGNGINFYAPGQEVVYQKVIYPCTYTKTRLLEISFPGTITIVNNLYTHTEIDLYDTLYSGIRLSAPAPVNDLKIFQSFSTKKRSSYKSFHLVTMLYIFMNTTNCRLRLKLNE